MLTKKITAKFRLALVWAALFVAIASGYWIGVREAQQSYRVSPKTYAVKLGLFHAKPDVRVTVGQLGLAVIFILTILLWTAIALAVVAEHRRRRVQAVNRKLIDEIGERKRAQDEVAQLNAELEWRVKARTRELQMATKELEDFCYSASHDLRAPLRTIDGFSDILLKDHKDKLDEQGRRYLQRVRIATQRMAQLIDDLLSLSRVTRTKMRRQEVDLTTATREIVNDLRRLDSERKVDVTIPDGLTAQSDPGLLKLVLENLLGNAWKYTSKEGAARIELGTCAGRNGSRTFFV